MTRVYLVRHAETDASERVLAGRQPGWPLNARGRAQAASLAWRLRHVALDAVYCSPLERARETAAAIASSAAAAAAAAAQAVTVCDQFDEMAFGDWTGLPFEDLSRDPRFARFNMLRSANPPPGGETMLEVQARMVAGLQRLQARHPDGTVAVVGHADPIRAALAFATGMPLDMLLRLAIDPASVSVVDLSPHAWQLMTLNDGWLAGSGAGCANA